jgi:hypothetical protein
MLPVSPPASVATRAERCRLAVDSLNHQMAVTTTGRSTTGRYVSRAAATGPSRSHRGKTPINWSIALVVILVLGVASIAFSRYEYARSTAAAKPATWYAGLSFVRCGAQQAPLPASTAGDGVTTPGNGVLAVSLKDKSQATLGRFVDGYPGLVLGSTAFKYPGTAELRNGDRCPAGTPDAGKVGEVRIVSWSNFSESSGHTTTDPSTLALTNGQLVTAAFVPVGAAVPKPPQSTVSAVLSAIGGTLPTTTTAPAKKAHTAAPSSSDSTASTSGDNSGQGQTGTTSGTTHSSTTTKAGTPSTSAGGGGSGTTATTGGSTSNQGGSPAASPGGGTTTTSPPADNGTTTTAPPDTTTTAPPDTTTTAPPDTTTTTAPPDTTTTTAPPDTTTTVAGG